MEKRDDSVSFQRYYFWGSSDFFFEITDGAKVHTMCGFFFISQSFESFYSIKTYKPYWNARNQIYIPSGKWKYFFSVPFKPVGICQNLPCGYQVLKSLVGGCRYQKACSYNAR